MSHGGGGPSALGWLVIIIAGFFVLWYFSGGPQRAQVDGNDPFMNPLPPVGSGSTYGVTSHANPTQ